MAPAPDDVEAIALRARAEAEAAAIRGRAEVDARAMRAAAEADAAAVIGRAEVEAAALHQAAEADRDQARRVLEAARRQAEEIEAEAADVRRRTEQRTLDRLLATRADLHDAIERLTEMTEPVLDLTDAGIERTEALAAAELRRTSPGEPLDDTDAESVGRPGPAGAEPGADPVDALVRAAIGRAVDSAAAPGRSQAFSTEQPSRRREQMRDGRSVL